MQTGCADVYIIILTDEHKRDYGGTFDIGGGNMKFLDKFLLRDLLKSFRTCEIGFVLDDIQSYNKALASVRMRCYDMILALEQEEIHVELYKPLKKYKVVIFTKTKSDRAVILAKKLKEQGTIVIADMFCENLSCGSKESINILQLLKYADYVITFSKQQMKQFSEHHSHVGIIEEGVNDAFFKVKKKHEDKDKLVLLYCGYSRNAKDTLVIKDVMKELLSKYSLEILYICEKDPELKEFPYCYKKYNQNKIPQMLLEGDIMIAPRPMKGIEGLQHTLSKVAHPMAVGLPVVANPVPSYVNTPVILCTNDEEWMSSLCKLIQNKEEREKIGDISRKYVKDNYSQKRICQQYIELIQGLMRG